MLYSLDKSSQYNSVVATPSAINYAVVLAVRNVKVGDTAGADPDAGGMPASNRGLKGRPIVKPQPALILICLVLICPPLLRVLSQALKPAPTPAHGGYI